MKKIFSFIIILGLLFFIFQFGVTMLKSSHVVNYEINVGEQSVKIIEEYKKTKKDDYYFFKVDIDGETFVFDVDNKFNKQKHIIDDFKIYKEKELTCLSPVYTKNNDDAQIICSINGVQTSYTTVKEQYNMNEFVSTLENFNSDKFESSNVKVMLDKMNIYKDNVYEDEYLVVYDYKELIKISKNVREKIKFSNYDIYHNEMGRLIDKYYVLPNFENKPEYSGMLVIDIINKDKKIIKFDDEISTNLYVNGIVDNKLYFFDRSNFIQYEISPKKTSYRIVGNKTTNGQYFDGKWSTKNIYDFYNQNIIFNEELPVKDNYLKAYETNKYYYYYNSNNEFYKVYKEELDNPILLFKYDNIKEVIVINDRVYFINENTIYRYDETGIKILVTNNEFKYNYENIYGVYYKG